VAATPLGRIATGPVRAKNPHRKRCIYRELMLEQIENMPEARSGAVLLWKSMMAQAKAATRPGAWD